LIVNKYKKDTNIEKNKIKKTSNPNPMLQKFFNDSRVSKGFLTLAIILLVVAIAAIYGTVHFKGVADVRKLDNDTLTAQYALCDSVSKQSVVKIAELQKTVSDGVSKENARQEVSEFLNNMLLPANIVGTGWNVPKIRNLAYYLPSSGNITFNNRIQTDVAAYFGPNYAKIKQAFMTAPGLWLVAFRASKAPITWMKNHVFNSLSIDEDLLPYLQMQDEKKYWPRFNAFFVQHTTTAPVDYLYEHPKWEEFQKGFYTQFPDSFDGEEDRDVLIQAYRNWRTAKLMPPPARAILVTIIKEYNAIPAD
jgi:hypothetical protein